MEQFANTLLKVRLEVFEEGGVLRPVIRICCASALMYFGETIDKEGSSHLINRTIIIAGEDQRPAVPLPLLKQWSNTIRQAFVLANAPVGDDLQKTITQLSDGFQESLTLQRQMQHEAKQRDDAIHGKLDLALSRLDQLSGLEGVLKDVLRAIGGSPEDSRKRLRSSSPKGVIARMIDSVESASDSAVSAAGLFGPDDGAGGAAAVAGNGGEVPSINSVLAHSSRVCNSTAGMNLTRLLEEYVASGKESVESFFSGPSQSLSDLKLLMPRLLPFLCQEELTYLRNPQSRTDSGWQSKLGRTCATAATLFVEAVVACEAVAVAKPSNTTVSTARGSTNTKAAVGGIIERLYKLQKGHHALPSAVGGAAGKKGNQTTLGFVEAGPSSAAGVMASGKSSGLSMNPPIRDNRRASATMDVTNPSDYFNGGAPLGRD